MTTGLLSRASFIASAHSRELPRVSRRSVQSGVTLIELVISIVVIAIAVSAVLGVFAMSSRQSADAMVREQAVAIASAYLEEIQLKSFNDPDGVDGESVRANFDDVDDYNALNDNTGARDQTGTVIAGLEPYRVTVAVGTGSLGSLTSASDVKRIDVTVSHTLGYTTRLSGYRARY